MIDCPTLCIDSLIESSFSVRRVPTASLKRVIASPAEWNPFVRCSLTQSLMTLSFGLSQSISLPTGSSAVSHLFRAIGPLAMAAVNDSTPFVPAPVKMPTRVRILSPIQLASLNSWVNGIVTMWTMLHSPAKVCRSFSVASSLRTNAAVTFSRRWAKVASALAGEPAKASLKPPMNALTGLAMMLNRFPIVLRIEVLPPSSTNSAVTAAMLLKNPSIGALIALPTAVHKAFDSLRSPTMVRQNEAHPEPSDSWTPWTTCEKVLYSVAADFAIAAYC